MQEEWKLYKEYYAPWNAKNPKHFVIEVSNLGRVRKNGIIQQLHGTKYLNCCSKMIHRIVAELFLPNPENKPCVDHINCNKHDNRAVNLRWVTYSENMLNPITRKHNSNIQKHCQSGEKNGMYGKHHKQSSKKLIATDHYDRTFVNNGIIEKFPKKENLDMFLSNGFILGRLPFSNEHKKNMSNSRTQIKSEQNLAQKFTSKINF